jgi:hypothetical protein
MRAVDLDGVLLVGHAGGAGGAPVAAPVRRVDAAARGPRRAAGPVVGRAGLKCMEHHEILLKRNRDAAIIRIRRSRMTVTIATPDRQTVTALSRSFVDARRLTACLERASATFDGAYVRAAKAVAVPFVRDSFTFAMLGELALPAPTSWQRIERLVAALSAELRAAGFTIE